MMKKIFVFSFLASSFISCRQAKSSSDATGSFEAVETIISAQASGEIKALNIEEGQLLHKGDQVGYIDTIQLYLKKKQLLAQSGSVLSRRPDIPSEVSSLLEQLKQAEHEQQRIGNLVKADAATPKQLDDANAAVAILRKQIDAKRTALGITSKSLEQETSPIGLQIAQLEDQIAKSTIVNPVNGTVLTKYAEANEIATMGKPLYKIADLSTIILRAYITGNQLAKVKIGQQLTVMADDGNGKFRQYNGIVNWISNKAEFTPKTIQTKDERANLVYAIKIKVANDGYLKIGMYGEIKF